MVRPLYRSRQVYYALRPHIEHSHLSQVHELLSPALSRVFFSMELRDQRHSLEVVLRLRDQGVEDGDLLAAALLHDCGKGEVPVWLRVGHVVSPSILHRVASVQAGGWRSAAHRLLHHARIGARIAEAAGASEATVRYIAGEVEPHEQANLALLMSADDAS